MPCPASRTADVQRRQRYASHKIPSIRRAHVFAVHPPREPADVMGFPGPPKSPTPSHPDSSFAIVKSSPAADFQRLTRNTTTKGRSMRPELAVLPPRFPAHQGSRRDFSACPPAHSKSTGPTEPARPTESSAAASSMPSTISKPGPHRGAVTSTSDPRGLGSPASASIADVAGPRQTIRTLTARDFPEWRRGNSPLRARTARSVPGAPRRLRATRRAGSHGLSHFFSLCQSRIASRPSIS